MKPELLRQIEGYDEILKEIEISRKFGVDHSIEKGKVREYVDRLHPASLSLKVADIIVETPSAKTLRLISPDRPLPPFQAGQYISVHARIGRVLTSRAYSISSSPRDTAHYDITVRGVEGGFVSGHLLNEVKPGDILFTSGPSGNFCYNPVIHDTTMVMLAGGSGITPFMSMVREAAQCGLDRDMYLFYGNRSEDDVIFHHELSGIASKFPNIKYIPVIEKPSGTYKGTCGYISGSIIKKTLGDVTGKTFYVCGPSAMYDFCIPELQSLNVPHHKIRRELYGVPRDITAYQGWPSRISRSAVFTVKVNGKKTIKAAAAEPLLNSLEREGVVLPAVCRSGECSMCRVKLVSGTVFQPEGVLIRKSDRRYGYIHSCAAYPLENLEILV